MSNNEDSTASLGDSEVLSIKHSPCDTIPELSQRCEYDSEIASRVGGKETRDVFDDEGFGFGFAEESFDLPEEFAAFAFKACSSSCDAEVLAGKSSCNDPCGWVKSCIE
jgi:hypothetical protein